MNKSMISRAVAVFATSALTLLGILAAGPAFANPNPQAGTTTGGTSVTIEGIHFVQVESGGHHSIGLTSEGTVYTWGRNSSGQLGDGSTTNHSTPVQVVGVGGVGYLTGVTSIAAGGFHSLAVTSAGIYAWGNNSNGQLGDGFTTNRTSPVLVAGGLTGVIAISSGSNHSLALTSSGVFAWGYNADGELGDGSTTNRLTPVSVAGGLTGVTAIDAGAVFSLALTSSGIYAWGQNADGELGDGSTTDRLTPVSVTGGLTGVTAISAGGTHSLALTSAGIYAWGYNSNGQLGDGSITSSPVPIQVLGGLTGTTAISAGGQFSLALTSTGAYSWGTNSSSSLGDGSTTDRLVPVPVVGGLAGVTAISAGSYHSLALTSGGIYSWGADGFGQLGDGMGADQATPVLSANFLPASVMFGAAAGSGLVASGSLWTVNTPSGAVGNVVVIGTANVFGGVTPATPATVSWNAGIFSYEAALANTGTRDILPLGLASAGAVLFGVGLLLALRRQHKK